MSTVREQIEKLQEQQGWTDKTLLGLLLDRADFATLSDLVDVAQAENGPPPPDFSTDHLDGTAVLLADTIRAFMFGLLGREPTGGGCRAFWSPEEWRKKGEQFGGDATLVLCHDGGDLSNLVRSDQQYSALTALLAGLGYYLQPCTAWYTAVYPIKRG